MANLILNNGVVYTAAGTIAEALVISGERIVAVGSNDEVRAYCEPGSKIVDLAGRLVIPGMIDSHIHPPGLALMDLYEVKLFEYDNMLGYIQAVRDFLLRNPAALMVYGRGWSWGVLSGEDAMRGPRKEELDAVSTDIPIVLRANDGHTLWLNSKALAINNIRADIVVPGGVIECDPVSGELWGTLKEAAMRLVALPEYSQAQYTAALLGFQQKLHRWGITAILAMGSMNMTSLLGAFDALRSAQQLQLRVRAAVSITPNDELDMQLDQLDQMCRQYQSLDLAVTTVKFFTDGVVEGATSHLLAPYTNGGKSAEDCGEFLWGQTELAAAFAAVMARDLDIHVHSTGDASTRKVLTALEQARALVPNAKQRNAITHLQLVAPSDIARFREHNVIASVQPYWQFKGPNWWHEVDYRLLGERAERQFPLRSLFDQDVIVASSSDYPATVEAYPLRAIEIGVTRNLEDGSLYGLADITDIDDERYLLNRDERVKVEQMVDSFTINGAYLLGMSDDIGTLAPGMLADLVVLDQNILTVDPLAISNTKVILTMVGGQVVYQAK